MSNKINRDQLADFITEARTVKAFDLLFKDVYENIDKTTSLATTVNSLTSSIETLLSDFDNLKTRLDFVENELDVTMEDLSTLTTAHNQLRTEFDDYVATHP